MKGLSFASGFALGLLLSWLWHRAALAKLTGLLEASESRYKRLRQNAEARLDELRARLKETGR